MDFVKSATRGPSIADAEDLDYQSGASSSQRSRLVNISTGSSSSVISVPGSTGTPWSTTPATVGKIAASHIHPLGGPVVGIETDSQTDDVGGPRDPTLSLIHQRGTDSLPAVAVQPVEVCDLWDACGCEGWVRRRGLISR